MMEEALITKVKLKQGEIMQAYPYPGESIEEFDDELRSMIDHPIPYNEKRMLKALKHPNIKYVRVFRRKRKSRNKTAKASRRNNR